jgi:hypothetical protein
VVAPGVELVFPYGLSSAILRTAVRGLFATKSSFVGAATAGAAAVGGVGWAKRGKATGMALAVLRRMCSFLLAAGARVSGAGVAAVVSVAVGTGAIGTLGATACAVCVAWSVNVVSTCVGVGGGADGTSFFDEQPTTRSKAADTTTIRMTMGRAKSVPRPGPRKSLFL